MDDAGVVSKGFGQADTDPHTEFVVDEDEALISDVVEDWQGELHVIFTASEIALVSIIRFPPFLQDRSCVRLGLNLLENLVIHELSSKEFFHLVDVALAPVIIGSEVHGR